MADSHLAGRAPYAHAARTHRKGRKGKLRRPLKSSYGLKALPSALASPAA